MDAPMKAVIFVIVIVLGVGFSWALWTKTKNVEQPNLKAVRIEGNTFDTFDGPITITICAGPSCKRTPSERDSYGH